MKFWGNPIFSLLSLLLWGYHTSSWVRNLFGSASAQRGILNHDGKSARLDVSWSWFSPVKPPFRSGVCLLTWKTNQLRASGPCTLKVCVAGASAKFEASILATQKRSRACGGRPWIIPGGWIPTATWRGGCPQICLGPPVAAKISEIAESQPLWGESPYLWAYTRTH